MWWHFKFVFNLCVADKGLILSYPAICKWWSQPAKMQISFSTFNVRAAYQIAKLIKIITYMFELSDWVVVYYCTHLYHICICKRANELKRDGAQTRKAHVFNGLCTSSIIFFFFALLRNHQFTSNSNHNRCIPIIGLFSLKHNVYFRLLIIMENPTVERDFLSAKPRCYYTLVIH